MRGSFSRSCRGKTSASRLIWVSGYEVYVLGQKYER